MLFDSVLCGVWFKLGERSCYRSPQHLWEPSFQKFLGLRMLSATYAIASECHAFQSIKISSQANASSFLNMALMVCLEICYFLIIFVHFMSWMLYICQAAEDHEFKIAEKWLLKAKESAFFHTQMAEEWTQISSLISFHKELQM